MDRLLEATHAAERCHFWFHGFRHFVRPLVVEALRGLEHPRILDCGCGTGHNVRWLGESGTAFGFDLTAVGLALARRDGANVVRADVSAVPFRDGWFDLATSFDVLYSLTEEQEGRALREMHRVLRPGGHVIVNTAAFEALRGNHSILAGERRRHRAPQLQRALDAAGFTVRRLTYTNATLFPILLALRTGQRMVGLAEAEHADAEISLPPAVANAAMKRVLELEAWFTKRWRAPFGSSVLSLATKR